MHAQATLTTALLAVCLAGCGRPSSSLPLPGTPAGKPDGMKEFEYLACDGGPHLVLPQELGSQWKGGGSTLGVLRPRDDYGSACAATANARLALLPVGTGQAMALADPPMTAWGRSPEGWVDIYYLQHWSDMDLDGLIKRAVAATPTSGMRNTGKAITLATPGLILLFAGDRPGDAAYGERPIPAEAGIYQILEGQYQLESKEGVVVYRLRPQSN